MGIERSAIDHGIGACPVIKFVGNGDIGVRWAT